MFRSDRLTLYMHILANLAGVFLQELELLEEVMFLNAHGALKETGQVAKNACLAAPLSQQSESSQINHQRRRQDRVATLPGELHVHLHAQEALEMNEIPGSLPIVQRLNELDGNVSLRLVADDLRYDLIFGSNFGGFVFRIVEDFTVTIAKNVVAHPAQDSHIPAGKHRGQDRFEQGLSGFAVLAADGGFL